MVHKRKLAVTDKGKEECKRLMKEYLKRSSLLFRIKMFYIRYKTICLLIAINLILLACLMIKARTNKPPKLTEEPQTLSLPNSEQTYAFAL